MSAIYVVAKEAGEFGQLANRGAMLLLHLDAISAIGEEFGLKRLDECVYLPDDQLFDFLRDAGATDEQIAAANPPLWIEAQQGVVLMGDYVDRVRSYHSLSEQTRTAVLAELEEFEKVFEALAQTGDHWHFEYDI